MFISGISGGTQSLGGIGHQSSNFVKGPVPFSFALVGGGGGAGVKYTGGGGAGALIVGTSAPVAPGTVVSLSIGAGAAATNLSNIPGGDAALNSYHGGLTQQCGLGILIVALGGSGAKGRLAYTCCQGSCGGSGGGGGGSPPGPSPGTVPPSPQFSGWGVTGCIFGGPTSPNAIWTLYGNPGGNFFGGGGGAGGAGVSRLCKSSLNSTRTTDGAGGAGQCLPGWGPGGSGIVLAGGGGGGGLVTGSAPACTPFRFVGGAPGPGGGGAGGGYGQPVASQSGGGGTNAGTPTWPYPSNVTLPTAGTYGTGGGGGGSLYVASGPNNGSTIGSGGGSGTFMLKVPTPLIGIAVVPPSAPPIGLQTWPDGAGNTVFKFNTSGTYTF